MTDQKLNLSENPDNESYIALKQPQILQQDEDNMIYHDQETHQQRKIPNKMKIQ